MIYEYKCNSCDCKFDVVKSVAEMTNPEVCLKCDSNDTVRLFSSRVSFIGAKVKDSYYDYALGKVVKNEADRRETVKQKELIEVGTETTDSMYKHTVEKRAKEKEKEWDDL